MSEKEQYNYGFEAGVILKEIHQINSPSSRLVWDVHYNRKVDKKIAMYKDCGITFKHAGKILAYIEANRNLVTNRPQCFQHGDFHIGNMLITPQKQLAVIDFNRLDFGDPWSASQSIWFASGQINGYFNNDVPTDFFKLMALYIGVNQLGAIPWAIPYGKEQVKIMLEQVTAVLEWYDNFSQSVPKWYQKSLIYGF